MPQRSLSAWVISLVLALAGGVTVVAFARAQAVSDVVDLAVLDAWVQSAAGDLAAASRPAAAPRAEPEEPEDQAPLVLGGGGEWEFAGFGRPVLVLASEKAGRMRTMSPVLAPDGGPVRPDAAAMRRVLEANFATALDARYVLRDGTLWAAYLHPLDGFDERQFRAGVQQVLNLSLTYGTTYSSTEFRFGAPPLPPDKGAEEKEPEGMTI